MSTSVVAAKPSPPWTRRRRVAAWSRRITAGRPHLLVVAATLLSGMLAWFVAHLIRFEGGLPDSARALSFLLVPFVVLAKCIAFYAAGVFRILWAYMGLRDFLRILKASAGASAVLLALNYLMVSGGLVPGSVLILDGVLTFLGAAALFAGFHAFREAGPRDAACKPVLIVGAGDSGERLLRELQRQSPPAPRVVGFVDDDPEKRGRLLRGVPVLGGTERIHEVAARLGVRTVYIAVPSAGGGTLRRMAGSLFDAGLDVRILPPLGSLSTAAGFLPQLRQISIEDLIRREPVRLDEDRIAEHIRGKTVLVTGAAGSIGSELCRQVLSYRPGRLVALDCAETPLHDLMLSLRNEPGGQVALPELADVTDPARIESVFTNHRPDLVFHAAALKHVPMCEAHVREAIRVNVGGTTHVAEAAVRAGTSFFLMISTDKAVNPSSMMGATKRVAELIVQELNGSGPTRFCAVRFGNVLGSNGSVLRIFREQLARGGPLTVTHPEMRRYFMSVREAVQLVLQAAVLGAGGEVFELDMGEPVRILDLAKDLIRLSGGVPGRDVMIEFTGIRPGEKLFEELYGDSEVIRPTAHPKVFCLRAGRPIQTDPALAMCLKRLESMKTEGDALLERLREELPRMRCVPPNERVGVS